MEKPLADHGNPPLRPSIKDRAREELRRYAVVALYLYLSFGVILLYESALLGEHGVKFLPHGLAAAKALILGKFLLIGEAVGVGSRRGSRTLSAAVARRTAWLFVFLLVLTVLEELLVGWTHGRPAGRTLSELTGGSAFAVLAKSLLTLLILAPLVTVTECARRLGPAAVKDLLRPAPEGTAPAQPDETGRRE